MLSNIRVVHKGILIIVIPLVFELLLLGLIFHFINQAEEARKEQIRSSMLIDKAFTVTSMLYDTGRTLMSFWYSNDFTKLTSATFTEQNKAIDKELKVLWDLTRGNPAQRKRVESIQNSSHEMMNMFQTELLPTIEHGEMAGGSEVAYFGTKSEGLYTPLIKEVKLVIDDEKKRLERASVKAAKQDQYVKSIVILGVIQSGILCIVVWWLFASSMTQRLDLVLGNVNRFATRKPLNIAVEGTDEISILDRQFRDMAKTVIESEQNKQEFLSMISHDMRTPLSALQGTLAVAAMGTYGTLTEYGVERMEKAEANVGRLIALINDLLDVERIESGSLQLSIDEAEMWDLVSNAVDTVGPVADQKHIRLTNNCDEVFVLCDSRRVEQVLVNLIANAVKFSPENSEITIASEETQDFVKVSVTDQGRGISLEQQREIFERFKQAEESDKKKGYGLGLAIAKSLVEAHRGEIGVESEPGEGATFWFKIPLKP